jgi:multiple sugar transport system ATP-binding protein
VERKGDGLVFDGGSFQVNSPASRAEALAPYSGKTIVLGIRPSDIFGVDIHPPHVQPNAGNQVKALCEVTEPMGDRVHLYLSSAPHSFIADVEAETQAAEDRQLDLILDMEKSHAFDKETEAAIY